MRYVPAGPAGTVTRHQREWSTVVVTVVRPAGPVTVTTGGPARSGSACTKIVAPDVVGSGSAWMSSGRAASRYGTVAVVPSTALAWIQPLMSAASAGRGAVTVSRAST